MMTKIRLLNLSNRPNQGLSSNTNHSDHNTLSTLSKHQPLSINLRKKDLGVQLSKMNILSKQKQHSQSSSKRKQLSKTTSISHLDSSHNDMSFPTSQSVINKLSQDRRPADLDVLLRNRLFKVKRRERHASFDNRFNIIYSQNLTQFEERYRKLQQARLSDKQLKTLSKRTVYIENKLNEMNSKVTLLKGITDYVYPNIVAMKLTEQVKTFERKKMLKIATYLTPSKRIDMLMSEKKQKITDFLSKSIIYMNKSKSEKKVLSSSKKKDRTLM